MRSTSFTVEHVAWQTSDPVAVAAWYGRHLGFTIARKLDQAPHTHFLADAAGRVVVEIYNNPKAPILDYRTMDPLMLHLAFSVADPEAARDQLLSAGATVADNLQTLSNGDRLIMLRDPWGFAIQLVARAKPLL
ncbi:MAG: VOC family protein [Opitutaceae bacterium]